MASGVPTYPAAGYAVGNPQDLAGSGWQVSGPSVTMEGHVVDGQMATYGAGYGAPVYYGSGVGTTAPLTVLPQPAAVEQARLDTNNDGVVTQQEEIAGAGWTVAGPSVMMTGAPVKVGNNTAQQAVDRHVAMDTNNDGVVSYAERAAAQSAASPMVVQ